MTKKILSVFALAAIVTLLTGCPPSNCNSSVDFEAPLVAGTQYGAAAGQSPRDVIFTSGSIPVRVHKFLQLSGNTSFDIAAVTTAPPLFGSGTEVININIINLAFDLSSLGYRVSEVTFDFLDIGGSENLSFNGSPMFSGNLPDAPATLNTAAVTVIVTTTPVQGGMKGSVRIKGIIDKLTVGGQEFWMDNFCTK
ncbi:MAG: hypothetical protein ACK5DD_04875 [Cyclobacteriaceae bacterium]|jgi:hypothetical protein